MMGSTSTAPDVDTTRSVLLKAARVRFALYPYPDVTLRDIAHDAGVSATLVIKYFGSKIDLFREVVDFGDVFVDLLAAPIDHLAPHLATGFSARINDPDLPDPFLGLLLNSVGRDVPEWVRAELLDKFVGALARRLKGPDRILRSELVCAQLMGLSAMRRALKAEAVSTLPADELAAHLGPLLQALIAPPGRHGRVAGSAE
jgi:AcrR family transcriptional regulator